MGYGVVRPTLGGLTSKVLLLGFAYFVASELLEVVENEGKIDEFTGKARLFLVLPVAFLDAILILWVFTSLSKTLEKLQARRRWAKLEIYRKFKNALAVAVVVSIAWIGYENGDSFAKLANATQVTGSYMPISLEKPVVELVKITDDMKNFKAYQKLRVERMNQKMVGPRLKRATEVEKEKKK